jgi:hypothetical protein
MRPSTVPIENFDWCTVCGSDRAEHVDRALVDVRGHRHDVFGAQAVGPHRVEQRIGRGMGVPARCMELERGLGERPARAETVDQARRIGFARQAGRPSLPAVEDALRARESVGCEICRSEPANAACAVCSLPVGGLAQELPQTRGLRSRRSERVRHGRRRGPAASVAAAAASVPAVPVVWNTV